MPRPNNEYRSLSNLAHEARRALESPEGVDRANLMMRILCAKFREENREALKRPKAE
ncbi:hypothetical protein RAM80_02040 [Pseudomonas sp. App30]|uniref:hypothetical protein n=1 Tax=Pseudomonas sp. App30 TaxID=3068990 RepID=UPI003A7FF3F8